MSQKKSFSLGTKRRKIISADEFAEKVFKANFCACDSVWNQKVETLGELLGVG